MNFLNKIVSSLHTRQQSIHPNVFFNRLQLAEKSGTQLASFRNLAFPFCHCLKFLSLTHVVICTGITIVKLDLKNADTEFHSNLQLTSSTYKMFKLRQICGAL